MAVELEDDTLLVIHAMPLRDRYSKAVRGDQEMAKVKKTTRKNPRTKAGTEITPEIADALAAEAERGYDLSKAKLRRVGRPSLAGAGASPRLSFRTTPDLYRAAQKRAKEEGRSVSDLAREAVARYVGS